MSASVRHKVVFIGPAMAGKTSIIHRYVKKGFYNQTPTIGSAFYARDVQTEHGTVTLQIWDTAGMEKFKSMIPKFSRGASAAVFVFDVTDDVSYEQVKELLTETKSNCGDDLVCVLVGNKMDLPSMVDVAEAQEFAQSQEADFLVVSAKTNEKIDVIFTKIAEKVAIMQAPMKGVDILDLPNKADEAPEKDQSCGC